MALLVLCEAKYRTSIWCSSKIKGINAEAAKHKIQPQIFTDLQKFESEAAKYDEDSSVLLLFASVSWLRQAAEILARLRIHPILSAIETDISLPMIYSRVAGDADDSMRMCVDYLHQCGKKRIALVGVSRDSWNDISRMQAFERNIESGQETVFFMDDGIDDCFFRYAAQAAEFDAVICTNDITAIHLFEFFHAHNFNTESLFLLSCTGTQMAQLYSSGITSVTVDFYASGCAMVDAHFNRLKYGWQSVQIRLATVFHVRGSTNFLPYTKREMRVISEERLPVTPHREKREISLLYDRLNRLERLICQCDLTDLRLIYGLLCGYNYIRMGSICFISAEAARYRVRKIRDMLGASNRKTTAAILQKFINREQLYKWIQNTVADRVETDLH